MKFDKLEKYCIEHDIALSQKQNEQFSKFVELLIEKNKVMNLTAITVPEQIEIKHLIDSAAGINAIRECCGGDFSLLDIGSGAGFPGIPLKILCPDSGFCLLDSLNKRVNFLNGVIEELGLNNIETVCVRAEDYKKRETFDICTSRAVTRMNVLLEYSMPFVKVGGYCIMYKSGECEEELKEAETAIETLGGEYYKSISYELPEQCGQRSLVIIKKIRQTPEKYPRRAGKPEKKPITAPRGKAVRDDHLTCSL